MKPKTTMRTSSVHTSTIRYFDPDLFTSDSLFTCCSVAASVQNFAHSSLLVSGTMPSQCTHASASRWPASFRVVDGGNAREPGCSMTGREWKCYVCFRQLRHLPPPSCSLQPLNYELYDTGYTRSTQSRRIGTTPLRFCRLACGTNTRSSNVEPAITQDLIRRPRYRMVFFFSSTTIQATQTDPTRPVRRNIVVRPTPRI